jgi:hypothetical protein
MTRSTAKGAQVVVCRIAEIQRNCDEACSLKEKVEQLEAAKKSLGL